MTPAAVRVSVPGPAYGSGSGSGPAPGAGAGQAPLTHHEILAWVEPFVRAGLAPDMAASDRAARRVVFRARAVAPSGLAGLTGLAPDLAAQPLTETWTLDASDEDELGVARELAWPQGPAARLEGRCPQASSEALAAMLASMQGVLPGQLFVSAAGPAGEVTLGGLTQRLAAAPARHGAGEPSLVLKAAQARLGEFTLRMHLSGVGGYPAEIELLRPSGARVHLPHDLLAVLGRAWEPLTELSRGWVARVTVRGEEPRRSREARARFGEMLAHLACTLAEPPPRFHARHRAARWGVVARGLTPWLVGLGVVGLALWARHSGGGSVLALLANVAPPLLMGLFFVRREMPRIALPRWPARPAADAWPATLNQERA